MTAIAQEAKALLRSRGIAQWQKGSYPDENIFRQDAAAGIGYVLAEGDEVAAVCAVTLTEELSYRHLDSGAWLTEDGAKYATIHRSAVGRLHQGKHLSGVLFAEVEKLAEAEGAVSSRVDSQPDNKAMQRALERAGFLLCGTLVLAEGNEAGDLRLGYEKLI